MGLNFSVDESVAVSVTLTVALALTGVVRSSIAVLFSNWSPEAFSCAREVLPAVSHLTKTKTVARVTDSDNS